jgi:Flp pilus assembly protein TadD
MTHESEQNNTTPETPDVAPPAAKAPPLKGWKLLVAWGILLVIMPVAILLIAEMCLRLGGYGYDTAFVRLSPVENNVWVENPAFSHRFFPPALAREANHLATTMPKPENTYRVVILGGSAAMGDPAPDFSFGRVVEKILAAQLPNTRIEIVDAAMTAINSHVVLPIARDCAKLDPDLFIIYMGNNEVVGPFGPGSVFGEMTPSLGTIRASLWLRTTKLGQLGDSLMRNFGSTPAVGDNWQGMEFFLNAQIRETDPRLTTMYSHFRANLEDIVAVTQASGAQTILCTVGSDLRDTPPFASLHSEALVADPAKQAEWERLYQVGSATEDAGDPAGAIPQYESAAAIDASHAEFQYRWGRALLHSKQEESAKEHLVRARDLDALRFRADTRINEIIREVAAAHAANGVTLLDAADTLAKSSEDGIPGSNHFFEHVHFTFHGNYTLGAAVAETAESLLPEGLRAQAATAPTLSEPDVARRLAHTTWDEFRVNTLAAGHISRPPFTNQLGHEGTLLTWEERLDALRTQTQEAGLPATYAVYQEAAAQSPEDWRLHTRWGDLLNDNGAPAEAEQHWRMVMQHVPHAPAPYIGLGKSLQRTGRAEEAVGLYELALDIGIDPVIIRGERALAYADLKRFDEALQEFDWLLAQNPGSASTLANRGGVCAMRGDYPAAIDAYQQAVAAEPDMLSAHLMLGKLLGQTGALEQSATHFEQVLRLEPMHEEAQRFLELARSSADESEEVVGTP